MVRKILTICVAAAVSFFSLTGCKDKSEEPEEDVVVLTKAEYKAQAEDDITEENMSAELEKLEKEINQDFAP